MPRNPKVCTIATPTLGRYLVRFPAASAPAPVLVGFHGYGENAEHHLEELTRIPGSEKWLLVSVQALHRFYERQTRTVVASWMTSQDRNQMILDNVGYIDSVVEAIHASHATAPTLVYLGFSQGVAMAYRAGTRGRARSSGVIALAGDIPPELRDDDTIDWPAVLIGRGTGDPYYSQETMDDDLAFLRRSGSRLDSVVFDGGHSFHDDFRDAVGRFLREVRDELAG